MKDINLEWYVYVYNVNLRSIEKYNIFNHRKFKKDIIEILSKDYKDNIFETEVKSTLMYYYWSKCEWETEIGSWIDKERKVKIDVYEQVLINWDHFIKYLSQFRMRKGE